MPRPEYAHVLPDAGIRALSDRMSAPGRKRDIVTMRPS
jgi:hypothetical protein